MFLFLPSIVPSSNGVSLLVPQASNSDQNSNVSKLKDLLSKLPLGGDSSSQMGEAESLQASSKAYSFNPDDVAPKEVQQQLWALLKWRDGVYRDVLEKIEKIPGLSDLIDGITDALNACKCLYVYCALLSVLMLDRRCIHHLDALVDGQCTQLS